MTRWLLGCLLACGALAQDTPLKRDLSGRLEGATELRSDVRVTLWLMQEQAMAKVAEANATAEGHFQFTAVPWLCDPEWKSNKILLLARAGDKALGILPITGERDDFARLLLPLQPTIEIKGVVRTEDGKPIADASVSLWLAGNTGDAMLTFPVPLPHWQVRTDAEGNYRLAGLPSRKLVFAVLHPDHEERRVQVEQGQRECDVVLPPGACITGVLKKPDGSPAARSSIAAVGSSGQRLSRRTQTDEQGKFQLRSFEAGKYHLWAEVPGLTMPALESVPVARSETVTVPDLQLLRGGTIKGRIIDDVTGKPVKPGQRCDVTLRGPARPVATSLREAFDIKADGTFTVIAPPGTNELTLRVPREWTGGQLKVDVTDGTETTVEFKVSRKR